MTATDSADLQDILRHTFGFSGFRGKQEAVVARIMEGQHTCALMPTGAGKSLCYQLPAVARPGTAIVVSPLIALMHDQIRAAEAVGIRAASMTSADADNAATAQALRSGELDLLYVAPERANTGGFRALLDAADISLFAIDEAHCVSEWGHDFRPDYRQLRPMLDRFGHVPRLALTATADKASPGSTGPISATRSNPARTVPNRSPISSRAHRVRGLSTPPAAPRPKSSRRPSPRPGAKPASITRDCRPRSARGCNPTSSGRTIW